MITVLYLPRCGSRFFSEKIAEKNGYQCLGEVFNTRTYDDKIQQNVLIQSLEHNPNVVFKIGAWDAPKEKIQSYIHNSDYAYVCLRLNFNDQLKSLYAATAQNVDNFHSSITNISIEYDQHRYEELADWLITQYQNTVQIAKSTKIKVIAYESFATKEAKYARNFTWDQQPPQIKFNINKSVNEINDLET